MPIPSFRARWLAPALCLALCACSQPDRQARITALQAQVDPPRLWLAQTLGVRGEVTGAVLVCADSNVRDGFSRGNAEVDGRPCLPHKDVVDRPGLYANRCELGGKRFGLTVNRSGDPDRDFTIAFALTALDGSGAKSRQVRRYRDLGACPAGWSIGDQARPGQERGFNALKGTWGG